MSRARRQARWDDETSGRTDFYLLLGPLEQRGIGVEVMDTAAACRTYNLLKGDGRRVVAALLID